MEAGKIFLGFIGVLFLLFLIWLWGGGLERYENSKPFIESPIQVETSIQ